MWSYRAINLSLNWICSPNFWYFWVIVYSILTFWILFTSSLWTLYFGLELQWMLLTIFFIIGSSVCRGLFNYLILNGILSISLILGILLSNSLFFILGCFGKIGYFPFLLVLACLWYCSSYLFLMIDLINKWAYFGSFLVIFHLYILLNSFVYWFTLIHFLILMFFIKLILTIKHLILISSLINYLFIILLILVDEYLFTFSFLSYYSITTILIILMISYFISWFCFSFRRFYCSCSLYYCSCQNDRVLNNILANSITDVINVKFFILLSCICFLFFLFLLISLFPTIMFLNKFFSLNLLDNHSLSLVFNLVIFLLFIFQGFFLRSISLFLTLTFCVTIEQNIILRGYRSRTY